MKRTSRVVCHLTTAAGDEDVAEWGLGNIEQQRWVGRLPIFLDRGFPTQPGILGLLHTELPFGFQLLVPGLLRRIDKHMDNGRKALM